MARIIKIKNDSGAIGIWAGKEFAIDEEYTVPTDGNRVKWQNHSQVLISIGSGDLLIGDGSEYFSDVNKAIDWLKGNLPAQVEVTRQDSAPPFANKTTPEGKSLYRRKHGISLDNDVTEIAAGETKTLSLVVPYNNAKIDKLELIGANVGDSIDLKVYDTPTGTVTGSLAATGYTAIPNFMLNQFGFNVYVCGPFYTDHSNYDADLIKDMKIELSYTNNHASEAVIPYCNIVLHEVK